MTAKFHRKSRFVTKWYSISLVECNFECYYSTLMTKLSLRATLWGQTSQNYKSYWSTRCAIVGQTERYMKWPFCYQTFYKMAVIRVSVLCKCTPHFKTISCQHFRHHLRISCVQHGVITDYRKLKRRRIFYVQLQNIFTKFHVIFRTCLRVEIRNTERDHFSY